MIIATKKKGGEAYAFFDCGASKEEIERELPGIRVASQIPSELELSLREVKELEQDIIVDSQLLKYISENKISPTYLSQNTNRTAKPKFIKDLKYVLKADWSFKTNEDTARQLGDTLNGIEYTFGDGRIFIGAIVGKGDGEYGVWAE